MACSKVNFKSPDEILEQQTLLTNFTGKENWEKCIKPSEGIPCGPEGERSGDMTKLMVDSQKGNFECGCQNVAVDAKKVDAKTSPKTWTPHPPSNPEARTKKDPSVVSKTPQAPSVVPMTKRASSTVSKSSGVNNMKVDEQITDLVGLLKSRPDLFRKRNTSDPQTIQQINKVFNKITESYSNYTAMGKKNGKLPFLTYDKVVENLLMLGRRTELSAVANFYSDSVLSIGIVLTNALFIRQYGYQPTKSFCRDYAMPRVNPNGNTNLSIQMHNCLSDIFYFQDGHMMSGAGKPTVSSEDRALVSGLLC